MTSLIAEPLVDWTEDEIGEINIDDLITEDDQPVDNFPSAKNQRVLVEPLYNSPLLPRPFLADANVGIFQSRHRKPIVPDMFLSLNVEIANDWWAKVHRSYFIWEFGKPPEVVIEIVSNTKGEELGTKLRDYAQMAIPYYVVYDPQELIQDQELCVYELHVGRYIARSDFRLPELALSLTIWTGTFEDKHDSWLRWCNISGDLLLTGAEQALQERNQAEIERQRANEERQRADEAESRLLQMAEKLRQLGIDPYSL